MHKFVPKGGELLQIKFDQVVKLTSAKKRHLTRKGKAAKPLVKAAVACLLEQVLLKNEAKVKL